MSKELYFTDGNNEVKYLDTTASFNLAITQDGSAFDLTNATAIDVKVANDTGYVFTKSIDMATIKQPLAGLITMPVDAEVMNALVPDDYTIEVWVTLSSLITPGSQEGLTDTGTTTSTTGTTTSSTATTTYNAIFPSDDPQGFTITENVMSDSGDVIPVMSLDDFQQDFDQLKTDLTNKVATLQGPKGDTGPQGPQGIQGIQGPKGDTGATGATGPAGKNGATGPQGPQGIQGIKGDTGPIGPQGPQGERGKQVFKSSYEDAPNSSTNYWSDLSPVVSVDNPPKIGDTIITPSGNIFQIDVVTVGGGGGGGVFGVGKVLGNIKGDKGDKGDTGQGLEIKGKVDTTSQLPATASEGDGYLVGEELYVRVNNAWKDCGQIQGPAGKDGKDGATGPQGPQGPKGDTGAIGPRGPQGIQGPKGDTGATGATGPAGKDGTQVDLTEYAKTTDMKTAISAATANMVDSTKTTNFTARLQSGGVDVATAADIKSVEDSAWRELDTKYITLSSGTLHFNTHILYKIDSANKMIWLEGGVAVFGSQVLVTINFSGIAKNVTYLSGYQIQVYGGNPMGRYNAGSIVNNSIKVTTENASPVSGFSISSLGTPCLLYDELV